MTETKPSGLTPELTFDDLHQTRGKGQQLFRALSEFVQSQRPGTMLPSERVLADGFGVARMTIRQCITDLEEEGLVLRVPRRGTFVRDPKLIHSDIFRSFSEDMRLQGMQPGTSRLSVEIRTAGPEIAAMLDVEDNEKVYFVERVRTADGEPMALERTNIPVSLAPSLNETLSLESSLYRVLTDRYGVRPETAEQKVRIVRLSSEDAHAIGCAEHDPAFLIERSSRDSTGRVIEFGRSLYRADRYAISMQVHRPM